MKYVLKGEENFNPFISTDITNIIFKNRGISNIAEYVSPNESHLLDFNDLDNIMDGVHLLKYHLKKNHEIFLIVDSDVDGYTSASILYNYLKEANYIMDNIKWMVHQDKAHGINLNLIPEDTKLVICPDSSSNEYDKHAELKKQGIDTLVIDHHEAPEYSKDAIVINNQLSLNYENKSLSGAGVMYKFCQAMDYSCDTKHANKFLDLAAIGLIADMMDVTVMENRYIIQQGLKNINNLFLQALIKKQEFSLGNREINAIGVMFYIAPLINAVTRVGSIMDKQTLFGALINGNKMVLSTKRGSKENEEETLKEQAVRVCLNAKNKQKKIVDELLSTVEEQIEAEKMYNDAIIILKLNEIPNRSLTGLVANQVAAKYNKPTLLLILDEQDNYSGSGRNYNLSNIEDLKDCLNNTELFNFVEGHQSAFGISINTNNLDKAKEVLEEEFPNEEVFDPCYTVDFIFDANDLKPEIIRKITKLRPLWGKGFDEPLITVKNIPVNNNNFTFMGKTQSHMKFVHNDISFIKFWVKEDEKEKFENQSLKVTIVGRCDANLWNDKINYQIIIEDYTIENKSSQFAF